jgi:hypothetical protein
VESSAEGSGRFVRQVRDEVIVYPPNDAAQHLLDRVFTPFKAFDQEECGCCSSIRKTGLPTKRWCTGVKLTASTFAQFELFKEAVRVNAPVLLLPHVHPSGDVSPSPQNV